MGNFFENLAIRTPLAHNRYRKRQSTFFGLNFCLTKD